MNYLCFLLLKYDKSLTYFYILNFVSNAQEQTGYGFELWFKLFSKKWDENIFVSEFVHARYFLSALISWISARTTGISSRYFEVSFQIFTETPSDDYVYSPTEIEDYSKISLTPSSIFEFYKRGLFIPAMMIYCIQLVKIFFKFCGSTKHFNEKYRLDVLGSLK